jgi:hypothetical protein
VAVWSEVAFSKAMACGRIDAEYYDPELLKMESAVKAFRNGWAPLLEMTQIVTDGDHLKRNYVAEGVLFLTSENFQEHFIDYDSELRIPVAYEQTLARARSETGAIYLTKTGKWYGKAAVCRANDPVFNISADVAKIVLRPEYDPFFLACYLNSTIGYSLVRRESTGASRDRIVLDNLRSLPVPVVRKTELAYNAIVDQISEAHNRAAQLYAQAEVLLMEELGLEINELSPSLSYERSLGEAAAAHRVDADYFNPRHYRLLEKIQATGQAVRLGDWLAMPVKRGVQPDYQEDGPVHVINSQHVGKNCVELEENRRVSHAFAVEKKNRRALVRPLDVLINSTGMITIGRCQTLLEKVDAIVDQHVSILRPKEGLDPVYLGLFLNSLPGQMQT